MLPQLLTLACGLCCWGFTSVAADVLKAEVSLLESHSSFTLTSANYNTYKLLCVNRLKCAFS